MILGREVVYCPQRPYLPPNLIVVFATNLEQGFRFVSIQKTLPSAAKAQADFAEAQQLGHAENGANFGHVVLVRE